MKYNLKFQKWKHVHNLDFYTDLKHLYTVSSKCKRKYRQGTMTFGPPRTHNGTHTHTLNGFWPTTHAQWHTHTHTHTHTQWLQLPDYDFWPTTARARARTHTHKWRTHTHTHTHTMAPATTQCWHTSTPHFAPYPKSTLITSPFPRIIPQTICLCLLPGNLMCK